MVVSGGYSEAEGTQGEGLLRGTQAHKPQLWEYSPNL